MANVNFKTTVKTKNQLARDYDINVKTLIRWINDDIDLKQNLEKIGYKESTKIFTPKQVSLIHKAFGDPN